MDALKNLQKNVTQYTPNMKTILGPNYDYSAELKTPGDIGVNFGDGSWGGIKGAAAGVTYYSDAIGFGETTGFAKGNGLTMNPLGLKFFIKSGATCSNGQDMYQYIDTTPRGLPGRLGAEIEKAPPDGLFGARLRGLAPGIFEDAAKALNPLPMFNAVMNSGYARCRKVTLPVGDPQGNIKSPVTGEQWIDGAVTYQNGKPHASHWIFESWVSADQYKKDKKVEGFRSGIAEKDRILAGVLFAALFVGLAAFTVGRK
jgi:hypothetical protein